MPLQILLIYVHVTLMLHDDDISGAGGGEDQQWNPLQSSAAVCKW